MKQGNGYEGNGYHVCPHCFGNPPADAAAAALSEDFPCFKCAHGDVCALAGKVPGADRPLFRCRSCSQSEVFLKKSGKAGKFMVSCAGYDRTPKCGATVWFPSTATGAAVAGPCRNCQVRVRSSAV